MFGRCVCVKETMTYTEFVFTLSEAFSLKSIEINLIITYWMPGEMSVMIDTKRPQIYIGSQVGLDTVFFICGGYASLNLFVSWHSGIMSLRLLVTLKTIKPMRMMRRRTTKMMMGIMIIMVKMDLLGEVPSILP